MTNKPAPGINKITLVIVGLLVAMVFIVPLLIIPFKFTVSPSSNYGFNNIIAVLLMLVTLLAALILYLRFYRKEDDFAVVKNMFSPATGEQLKVKHLYIVSALYLLVIAFFYILGADYGYGEANYFLLRVDRIGMGQVPYQDFEYAYGLLLLYIPVVISKVFHLSTPNAYYLAFALFNCLGLYLLYYVVNYFKISSTAKRHLFYSLALCSLPFFLGVNYTMLRFVTPIACLLLINNLLTREYKNNTYAAVTVSVVSFAVVMLNFGISIEVGIAVALSVGSYFYFSFVFNKNIQSLVIAVIYTALIVLFSLFFSGNLILILKVFASGGNNFPVIPAPSILLYIISFLIINAILASFVIRKQLYFITFTLLAFNIIMLSGAFGRCDPGHIFWYGLGSFILLWAYLAHIGHRLYRWYKIAFIVIFTIGSTISGLFLYRGVFSSTLARYVASHPGVHDGVNDVLQMAHVNPEKPNAYINKYKPFANFGKIDQYPRIALPFDTEEELYLHILNKKKFVPGYYTGIFMNVYTPEQIAVKLAELKDAKHTYMIIPQSLYSFKPVHGDDEKKYISSLFLFPFFYTKKAYSEDLYTPVYNYLRSNYKVVEKYKDTYYLVERIAN
ncbi:MAG: hypothetical protein EOP47_15995 [Sphingobacteriaceae bacterium]|nr:MAG: hypothetical protein EOP47_15995 [Sphingobacteriaceae bacterium]